MTHIFEDSFFFSTGKIKEPNCNYIRNFAICIFLNVSIVQEKINSTIWSLQNWPWQPLKPWNILSDKGIFIYLAQFTLMVWFILHACFCIPGASRLCCIRIGHLKTTYLRSGKWVLHAYVTDPQSNLGHNYLVIFCDCQYSILVIR